MNPHLTRLGAFAAKERNFYPEDNNNRFAFALSQVSRYEEFVRIVFERHRDIAAEWISRTTMHFERLKGHTGTRELTREEIEEMESQSQLTTRLHLEVEAFYLFAKPRSCG